MSWLSCPKASPQCRWALLCCHPRTRDISFGNKSELDTRTQTLPRHDLTEKAVLWKHTIDQYFSDRRTQLTVEVLEPRGNSVGKSAPRIPLMVSALTSACRDEDLAHKICLKEVFSFFDMCPALIDVNENYAKLLKHKRTLYINTCSNFLNKRCFF